MILLNKITALVTIVAYPVAIVYNSLSSFSLRRLNGQSRLCFFSWALYKGHFLFGKGHASLCKLCKFCLPGYARRYCNRDGNWSTRKDSRSATNKKTDYLPCGEMLELKKRATVHLIAYGISVVALIPALLIFYSYKYHLLSADA